ncbi:MAG: hypothetical protein QOH06_2763 [Acidobacteriota bacterium]|jgi:hypothetical protein|nr:hypothetical protein [Acidobacteriota bacterium]
MKELSEIFAFPFLAAALAGLAVYVAQLSQQRATTRQALISEINVLLREIAGYQRYMSNDKHAWLQADKTVKESPVIIRSACKVYTALLPQLHLLPKDEISRVLAFYTHHESCDSLVEILFGRLKQQEQTGAPLTSEKVERNKRRVRRILDGLNDCLRQIPGGQIVSLRQLPKFYQLAETELPTNEPNITNHTVESGREIAEGE